MNLDRIQRLAEKVMAGLHESEVGELIFMHHVILQTIDMLKDCDEPDTLQICDTLEYQDKVKSEKIRLERNKQYLLKLKNQQQQIDQLNSVIEELDSKRQARAEIADQARVLQYQNQKASASTIRDLANQRLESQANNQLYMDFKINTN